LLLSPDPVYAEKKPVKIGLFSPLSGPQQPSGKAVLDGATLAVGQINLQGGIRGNKLKLIFRDDTSSSVLGVQILRDLADQEQCLAVIGSPQVATLLATMPIANEKQIPLLAPSWVNEITRRGNSWLFRVGAYDQLVVACLASFAIRDLKWRKISILHADNEAGIQGGKDFARAVKKLGGTPISLARFDSADRDFTVPINKILKKRPDGVAVWGSMLETAYLVRQLRQMGYHGTIIASANLSDVQFVETCGEAADNTVFCTPFTPLSRRPLVGGLIKDFEASFGHPPPSDAVAAGYDAVMLVAKAIQAGSPRDRKALQKALSRIKDYELSQGIYTYAGSQGDGLKSLALLTYLSRQLILLQDQYGPDPRVLIP
jgi:branched-chain amino acid transport system substrate-binding protein